MYTKRKLAHSLMLASIPLLTLPMLAESGMSRDRSQGEDSRRSMDRAEILRGEVFRTDGQEITLRRSHGERVSFRITDRTNQLCPKGTSAQSSESSQNSSSEGSSSMGSPMSSPMSSLSQSPSEDQGGSQRGFTFGDCNLQNGDFIKVKVGQNGEAIYVRSMGYQGGQGENYFQAGRMEDEYFVLPAGQLGGLDISDKGAQYTVKSSDGEQVGHVYRIMTNQDGDLTYAIVRKNDGQLISVPWQGLEGAGNQTFKLNVTKNQLGNLPILEEGENTVQHVQRHWDLSQEERKDLAKWNDRLDDYFQTRDRFYEDTPTFRDNREGYDRYDRSREARRQSTSDRNRHYQDQSSEGFQTRHYGFSPQEFAPPERAPQYEGADRGRSFDRDRQASAYDYDYRGSRSGQYPELGSRPGVAGERGSVSMFGSPSTLPPGEYAPQYEGADRGRSFDRDHQASAYDYDYRGSRSGQYPELGSRPGVAGERGSVSMFGSPSTLPPGEYAPQYEGADQNRSFDRNRQGKSFYAQGRERNHDDRFQATTRRSEYDPQREGAERYQSRRSDSSNYDYRPNVYRP